MKRTYSVIRAYENGNRDPIELHKGDTVRLGEKSNDNGPWPNWIFCTSDRTGKSGWTPMQILRIKEGAGTASVDYTAKEMTVAEGDLLLGDQELNGWLWCEREADGQEGWVPLNCLFPIE